MHFTALALGAIVLEGALAQPAHRHAHRHQKRINFNNEELYANVDWSKIDWTKVNYNGKSSTSAQEPAAPQVQANYVAPAAAAAGSTPAPAHPGSSPAPAANPGAPEDTTPSTGSCSNLQDVYSDGDSSSQGPTAASSGHHKRALQIQDLYVGNTGGATYSSNIKPLSDCKTGSTQYSITFVNNLGSKQKFWLWNKIGADGQMDGMMKNAYFQFSLDAGQRAAFGLDPNTQIAFSTACGRAADHGNVPKCTIGEAVVNDHGPGAIGGSSYDVSQVTKNAIGPGAQNVPLRISAPGYSDSTNTECVYNIGTDNSPQNPGPSGKCAMGPNDASPFHMTATFG